MKGEGGGRGWVLENKQGGTGGQNSGILGERSFWMSPNDARNCWILLCEILKILSKTVNLHCKMKANIASSIVRRGCIFHTKQSRNLFTSSWTIFRYRNCDVKSVCEVEISKFFPGFYSASGSRMRNSAASKSSPLFFTVRIMPAKVNVMKHQFLSKH